MHFLLKHILFFLLWTTVLSATAQQYKFYGVNEGISSSFITSIAQDQEGNIWIATEDGLNRLDGINIVTYRNNPNDSTSLINNHVTSILEDSKGRFWVATLTGLCLYDRTTDRFTPYNVPGTELKENIQFHSLLEDKQGYIWATISGNGVVRMNTDAHEYLFFNTRNSGICSDHINILFEDQWGDIWLGSGQQGLSIYHPIDGTFKTYRHQPNDSNSLSSNEISSICDDNEGNIWIGTWVGGINLYSKLNQSFFRFDYKPTKITSLQKDRKGNIWIGTMGKGFEVYSTMEKKIINQNIPSAPVDLTSKVNPFFEDKQGNMWIGFFQKGICVIPPNKGLFTNYTFNPFSEKPTIGDGAVQPLYMDSNHELWVGVDGKGVYRLDSTQKIMAHYGMDPNSVLFNNVALCIYEDSKGFVWLGTFFDGLIRYNRKINQFDKKITVQTPPKGLLRSHIKDIREDHEGKLWIGTNGGGINIYDPAADTFSYLLKNEQNPDVNQLIDNYCTMIRFDHDRVAWIGTFHGLCSYNPRSRVYKHYSVKQTGLPSDVITYLKEDSNHNLWVGTQNGLVCVDASRENIKIYSINEGLPNAMINGIEEDANGNVWIVTNHGLSMYDHAHKTFTNYTTSEGLYTNEFMKNAIVKTSKGKFLIGSTQGVTSFLPTEDKLLPTEPINLLFNNLYVFNEKISIQSTENELLEKSINYVDHITLTHAQNSFSVEFSAVEFLHPDKVNYEVKMEGFDKNWLPVKNRMVTYTNLSPGEYTLQVRAWINNKEQALNRSLKITTLPPFWATAWAKFFYFVIILGISYLTYRYINDRITNKRKEQLMQAKLQFFTDISHEIRTPLTLILSPLNKLINQNKDVSLTSTYNLMYKNGIRLLQLVNQVMDLRAIEFGKKKLLVEEINITVFVRDLKDSFNNLAEEKNLLFTFSSEPEEIQGYLDTDIISKVLFNLISNAFKYTEKGGVDVSLKEEKEKLHLIVSDSGRGISPEQKDLIFERFYMINTPSDRKKSAGIGLHLTQKLVQLHHGQIQVESKEGEGSRFTVIIPIQKSAYTKEEFTENKTKETDAATFIQAENKPIKNHTLTSSKHKYTILVVEDNEDIRNLLLSELGMQYQLLEAPNGKEGLQLAMEKTPSLIISDVVMPEMDGIELCQKIRHHEKTKLIPFILLTARSSIKQQIEGLEHGADAYIAKPFNLDYLQAQIERLIQNRNSYLEKQTIHPLTEQSLQTVESADDKLLKKLNEIINEHMDDTELSVEVLSRKLGLSRTHLNRRMKELTGESPASYIRQLRLHQSAVLLKEGNLSIAEIAFKVGFSSPSYFSQAFRDYYGFTPKEYTAIEEGISKNK